MNPNDSENRDGIGARGLKTKLIVNYIPQGMQDNEFRDLFASIGDMDSCRVMRDKATGYCFGYGFVDYCKPEDALKAIEKLNGHHMRNKKLKVAFSKPPGSSKNANLYVQGLALSVTEEKLAEIFRIYGELITVKILNENGQSKGCGFVLFKEKPHADNAMRSLQNYSDGYGTCLNIKYAKETTQQQRSHPKFYEFLNQTGFGQTATVINPSQYANVLTYGVVDPNSAVSYSGGGYGNLEYGGAIRGRPAGTRFNPLARPNPVSVQEHSNIIYVYNIGQNATESDVYALFARYGRIMKVDITDKGYAFVHMPIPAEAAEAIRNLNGRYYNGKVLQVSLKKHK